MGGDYRSSSGTECIAYLGSTITSGITNTPEFLRAVELPWRTAEQSPSDIAVSYSFQASGLPVLGSEEEVCFNFECECECELARIGCLQLILVSRW